MNWKSSFRKDVRNKWQLMKEEYKLYEDTNNIGYLQQACGKMFSIVENYLQIKYDYQVKSYSELKALVKTNKNDYQLLLESAQLHYFYYNGEVQRPKDEIIYYYDKVYKKMRGRLQ